MRELNIISQDTTWYGRDLQRRARGSEGSAPLLPDLLRALLDGTGVPWYRLFYMYPSGITREMVDVIGSSDRILPYLDVPIQHGSDAVLERMRRPERGRTIREKAGWLREAIPGLVLRTTVIVGFPGETEAEFEEMLELLRDVRFERVGAFPYSIEEGTRAADMEGQLSTREKQDRLETLLDLQREISRERNEEAIGRRELVLVDRLVEDDPEIAAEGRTRGQALDVDGVTRIRSGPGLEPGAFVEVEIEDAAEYDLTAGVIG